MSEYQYYEFQTIDRQLTDRQIRELRAISSRATISRTRFSNYYTYGDLEANPRDLLVRYFDASLSFAHWFYVELAFRFPKTTVDMRGLRRYAAGQSLDVHSTGGDVVVAVAVERDDFDPEDDGQGWLSSVTAIRADIAGGDTRALYFAWLLDVQSGEIDDEDVEPARPDGLASLSPALDSFIDIMGLDPDLLAAAVDGASKAPAIPPAREIDRWIAKLDADERVGLLSRVARGDGTVGAARTHAPLPQAGASTRGNSALRTARALRARAVVLAKQRQEVLLAREAKERLRREREQNAARDRHLSTLAKRQAAAWRQVEALVITKRPGAYDEAFTLLQDLREIGERKGRRVEVTERIRAVRELHAKKPSFLARLRKAGF